MSEDISNGSFVYDDEDPVRHVGAVEVTYKDKYYVRWHRGYASMVPKDRVKLAPPGKVRGDQLRGDVP